MLVNDLESVLSNNLKTIFFNSASGANRNNAFSLSIAVALESSVNALFSSEFSDSKTILAISPYTLFFLLP